MKPMALPASRTGQWRECCCSSGRVPSRLGFMPTPGRREFGIRRTSMRDMLLTGGLVTPLHLFLRLEAHMPEKATLRRARQDKRAGKSASTQAGEFVREEMHHIREGKHGAASTKQAIAIGLSKARRAGVKLRPSRNSSAATKRSAKAALRAGAQHRKPSPRRSRATLRALKREGQRAASTQALARQAHAAA